MSTNITIGDRRAGDECPTYVIAEIGSNHDQDLGKALELIDAAADAGADAAKFQSLRFDRVHHAASEENRIRTLYRQIGLNEIWYPELVARCRSRGLHFISSVTYQEAVPLLVECGADAIKIASAQFDIFPEVVAAAAETGLPLVMSCGLATYGGIERMLQLTDEAGNPDVVLLHCVTQYPAAPHRTNLRVIPTLRSAFGRVTGYSDHTLGASVALASVACGAAVVEKHLTLDRSGTGPDHHFAATPDELARMIGDVRIIEQALGDGVMAPLTEQEQELRSSFEYKWVTANSVPEGSKIERDMLVLRRAPGGIGRDLLVGLPVPTAARDIGPDHLLEWEDVRFGG